MQEHNQSDGLDPDRVFVHRANYIEDGNDAFGYLAKVIGRGWRRLEVDFTMTGLDALEFCHPSQLGQSESWRDWQALFQKLACLGDELWWLLDIKFVDTGVVPKGLLQVANAVLGNRALFVSSRPTLLMECHRLGATTVQFFRPNVDGSIPFRPDLTVRKSTEKWAEPMSKVVVFCNTIDEARHWLARGARYVQVDAEVLNNFGRQSSSNF